MRDLGPIVSWDQFRRNLLHTAIGPIFLRFWSMTTMDNPLKLPPIGKFCCDKLRVM